jgi:hypothetical protein
MSSVPKEKKIKATRLQQKIRYKWPGAVQVQLQHSCTRTSNHNESNLASANPTPIWQCQELELGIDLESDHPREQVVNCSIPH